MLRYLIAIAEVGSDPRERELFLETVYDAREEDAMKVGPRNW